MPEGTSEPSRAIKNTGTGVAVFAVLGLYTRVLISSKPCGADPLASRASRQDCGELVGPCETVAAGVMESFERDAVMESRDSADGEEWRDLWGRMAGRRARR